jgi:UDP:flavonoid glycosyltransferase YjiC (YdhE family)
MKNKNRRNKSILFLIKPEGAVYKASFPLAQELGSHGYRVDYIGPRDHRDTIESKGFGYRVFDVNEIFSDRIQYNFKQEMEKKTKGKKSPGAVQMYRAKVRAHLKTQEDILQKLEELIMEDLPDLALFTPLMTGFSLPFLKLDIPVFYLNFSLISGFSLKVPPLFSGIVPKKAKAGLLAYGKNLLAWSGFLIRQSLLKACHHLYLRLCFGFSSFHVLKTEVKKYGGRLKSTEQSPQLQAPELISCPGEFDFPFLAHSKSRIYLGTSREEEPAETHFDWQKMKEEKPIIFCTPGSYSRKRWKYRKKLYESAINAIRNRPDLQLIVQMEELDKHEFEPFPENVVAEHSLSLQEVLAKTALIICHGGFDTVREAVFWGVPLIVFPCEGFQGGYAARVAFHHLGLKGNIKKVTPQVINNYIDRILGDGLIQESVKKMQKVFLEQKCCRAGIDFIDKFLSHSRDN